jgi:hypothetical protein
MMRFRLLLIFMGTASLVLPGCGKPKPPPIVPAEGTVYLDGKPLPFARVTFMPMLENFGAEYNSMAITDENGHFVLTCTLQNQPGAAAGKHQVLVGEHTPGEMRGKQQDLADYTAKLKNRPIPPDYAVLSKALLSVEVKAGETVYDLQLTRN